MAVIFRLDGSELTHTETRTENYRENEKAIHHHLLSIKHFFLDISHWYEFYPYSIEPEMCFKEALACTKRKYAKQRQKVIKLIFFFKCLDILRLV